MRVIKLNTKAALLILLAMLLVGYGCTRVEDDTRSGSLLVITSIVGLAGADEEEGTPLFSDICDFDEETQTCARFNDNAEIEFSNEYLQVGPGIGVTPSFLNDIVVNRYRVDYLRPNGRNTPGVDVPFGIDGTMNIRVPINGSATVPITVVRHTAKDEPPLSDLLLDGSEDVITTQAEMKFFGQDISGRTVSATGFLEIHFANFGDE